MGAVALAALLAGVGVALLTLARLYWVYMDQVEEIERDQGWHRMWTERIYDPEGEHHGD